MNGFRNEFGSGRRKLLVATISLVFGIAACNLLSEVFIRVPKHDYGWAGVLASVESHLTYWCSSDIANRRPGSSDEEATALQRSGGRCR